IENLLANTDKLTGRMKERVIEHAEQGLLSKKLATIITDYPIEFNEKEFELERPDAKEVQKIFEELEFRRLRDQFLRLFNAEEAATTPNPTANKSTQEKKKVAGSGQFSLFGSDEAESAEAYSRQKDRKSTRLNSSH